MKPAAGKQIPFNHHKYMVALKSTQSSVHKDRREPTGNISVRFFIGIQTYCPGTEKILEKFSPRKVNTIGKFVSLTLNTKEAEKNVLFGEAVAWV